MISVLKTKNSLTHISRTIGIFLEQILRSYNILRLRSSNQILHILSCNRFCFHGGKTGSSGVNETTAINTNDLLLLNSIHTITTQSAPWALGPADGPATCYHSAIPGGENNHQLIVYGGQSSGGSENDSSTSTLYFYDSVSESWSKPDIDSPPRRIEHTMVANLNTGIAYLFGGYPLTNELWSFDTSALTWQQFPNQTFTPSPRYHHTSTLLADGRMILIGGFDGNKTVNMNDTYVFDTNALEWSLMNATGKIPTSRRDHAATILPDGQSILIHGGTDKNYGAYMSDIAVLNCTLPDVCVWQTLPNVNPPVGRYAHTASLIGMESVFSCQVCACFASADLNSLPQTHTLSSLLVLLVSYY